MVDSGTGPATVRLITKFCDGLDVVVVFCGICFGRYWCGHDVGVVIAGLLRAKETRSLPLNLG